MHKQKSDEPSISFEQALKDQSSFNWHPSSPEPLVSLDYGDECQLKNAAFQSFLKSNGISLKPKELIPSPKPRHYRTTTKRRVFCERDGIGLGFSQAVKPGICAESELEPTEHLDIYKWLQLTLQKKSFHSLSRALNWLIVRGTYERQFLILNIYKMDGDVVRKLKQLTKLLINEKIVEGAMAYFDPTRSEYYLEAEKPPRGIQVKHLFGPRLLGLRVNDTLMRYSPTGFSQVNESMVCEMVDLATQMLKPEANDQLLDLYCGYGLFSHTVGAKCKKVVGVELSSSAIESAQEIAKRLKTRNRMQFHDEKIDASLVRDKFDPPTQSELILLDPPRKGCEPYVIANLAKRNPKRVLQIFCGTDAVPREILEWQRAGYMAKVIQPIDMFAGTPNLETMVLFEKKA